MGFFDKLKDKAKGVASETLHAAAETAQDKVTDAVGDRLKDVTRQATSGAAERLGALPGGSMVQGVAHAATDVAVETGVNVAADEATGAVGAKLGKQRGIE